jgi:hypothetical protein
MKGPKGNELASRCVLDCGGRGGRDARVDRRRGVSSGIARRRIARHEGVLHTHLTAYVVGVRDDPPPAPQGRFAQRVLRRDLVALVPSVKGEQPFPDGQSASADA